jgi:hypothetical protein
MDTVKIDGKESALKTSEDMSLSHSQSLIYLQKQSRFNIQAKLWQ